MIPETTIPASRRTPFAGLGRARNVDLFRVFLFAAGERQTAYCVHLILAALFFSPFLLYGHVLFANADLVTHNYPMLLLAKRNFLHGVLGLWNPYTFFGAPEAVAAGTPMFFPENWVLFLVPERYFMLSITFAAFFKMWIVGVAAHRFYSAELLNRRWALFASVTYQLSGWMVWTILAYVALSIFMYYTILLALIWTLPRRSFLQNYLLLSIVTVLMLLAGNIAQGCYALLGAGILLPYRMWSQRHMQPILRSCAVVAASWATALSIFCVRLLPIVATLRSGTRQLGCCGPYFNNASFLIARMFDTEIFGVSFPDSEKFFTNVSPLFNGFHLHWVMPTFFGVAAALLALWALASEKRPKVVFWSIYTVVVTGLVTFIQPFDALSRAVLSPIYHSLSLHVLPPVGFAALAAAGGAALEGTVRHRRVSRLTAQLFVFAVTVIALFILMIAIRNIEVLSKAGSNWTRLVVIGLVGLSVLFAVARRAWPNLTPRLVLPLLWTIAALSAAIVALLHPDNPTYLSHLKHLGSELLMFVGVAVVLVLMLRARAADAWRLGVWGGGAVLVLSLGIGLYPWTDALRLELTHDENLILAGLGALRLALAVFIFFLVLAATREGRLPARSVYVVFFVLLLAEQVPAGKVHSHISVNPFYPAYTPYPAAAPAVGADGRRVELDLADYRVNFPNTMLNVPFYKEIWGASNEICASVNVAYGVRSYGGFNNTVPLRTAHFMQNWGALEEPSEFCIYARTTDDRFLDLSGVGYTYDSSTGAVARRPGALSRMMSFTRFEVIRDDASVLERLKASDFQPLGEVILQEDPGFESRASASDGRILRFAEDNPDRFELDIQTDGPALVLFDDSFNPEWFATVDGVRRRVLAANYEFMAFPVPAGTSHVVLEYKPRSFFIGSMCAAAGIAALLLALLARVFLRWRAVQPQPARKKASHRYPGLGRVVVSLVAVSALQILVGPVKTKLVVADTREGIAKVDVDINSTSPVANLIDRNVRTFWEARIPSSKPIAIHVQYSGEGRKVSRYGFQVGTYGTDSTDRMPKSWELQASNDDNAWITLDRESAVKAWREGETREYTIRNPDTYKYYRLVITEVWNLSIVRMSEMTFR